MNFLICLLFLVHVHSMSDKHRLKLRDRVKGMFDRGFQFYMDNAFPEDELNPILCKGRSRDGNQDNWNVNDVLGNYSLTLVDSLDSFAVMNDVKGFEKSVKLIIQHVNFNKDSRVQVFETTIRALGALLSGHSLAISIEYGFKLNWYRNELLDLAVDLADRLLPAFETPSGIPYPRVHLQNGVLPIEVKDTCTAGAGSLLLEFGVLSRLTGNPIYETKARKALLQLWNLRSQKDLVGDSVHIFYSKWTHSITSIGAGIDSFYEYLMKCFILFGEQEYLDIFTQAYKSVMTHIKDYDGFIYKTVDMNTGNTAAHWMDSLSAFFPGLQVLYGDLENAVKLHATYFTIWKRFGAMPERFNWNSHQVDIPHYPLRPELFESTYALYQATRDPYYLRVGEIMLNDLENLTRTDCGYASVRNVETKTLDDRMESFFLSETLKYLYLLFDSDNFVNKLDSNFVFTTEGHFLPLPIKYLNPKTPVDSQLTCQYIPLDHYKPVSRPPLLSDQQISFVDSIVYNYQVQSLQNPTQHSQKPQESNTLLDIPGDTKSIKIVKTLEGININHLDGASLLLETLKDLSNVIQVNDLTLEKNERVYVSGKGLQVDIGNTPMIGTLSTKDGSSLRGTLASFGPILFTKLHFKLILLTEKYLEGDGVIQEHVVGTENKLSLLCSPLHPKYNSIIQGKVIILGRGQCSFVEKVFWAEMSHALGVIILSDDDNLFSMAPSQSLNDLTRQDGVDAIGIPSILFSKSVGDALLATPQLQERDWTLESEQIVQIGKFKIGNIKIITKDSYSFGKTDPTGLYRRNQVRQGLLDPGQSLLCKHYSFKRNKSCFYLGN